MIPSKSILIPEESSMEFKNTHDLIVELKRAKKESEYTLEQIEKKDRRMDEKDDMIRRLMDICMPDKGKNVYTL